MTEQTERAEEWSPYDGRTVSEIIDDFAIVRGDLSEQYARDQLVRLLTAREAAAEARGAEQALREAADEFEAEDEPGRIIAWLRARAAARGVEGGAR